MPRARKPDVFAMFDPILSEADSEASPWESGHYIPEIDLLRELLSVPISTAVKQESGRVAKALDAWVAHELRRAGFLPSGRGRDGRACCLTMLRRSKSVSRCWCRLPPMRKRAG